jgi:2-dehydropantoate 2-reductase
MTIEIIGSGAMGMIFGARLSLHGNKVRMRTRTSEQAELLNEEGIHYTDLLKNTSLIRVMSKSGLIVSSSDDTEWILLTVKQTGMDENLYSLLKSIATPETPVVCVQNGIGHMEKLRSLLPGIPFLAAVSTEGALRTGQNSVMYTGKGGLWIEELSDNRRVSAQRLHIRNAMISSLQCAHIDVQLTDDIHTIVRRKLLINSVINPLTAIFGVNNGQLPAEPIRLQLMKALFEETRHILETVHGQSLGDNLWDYVLKVCVDTAHNESSMLADVRAQRPTEVKWINGGVIELAKQLNVQAPLNDAMVKLIESLTITKSTATS